MRQKLPELAVRRNCIGGKTDHPKDIVAISTWDSSEDWQNWYESEERRRSDRYNRTFSLVFMDVDFFKQYNDTHGHTKGDDLLRSLARILMDSFRKADLIARYGGDEKRSCAARHERRD